MGKIEKRNGIEIEFFQKSFAIKKPVITSMVLFIDRPINERIKNDVFEFIQQIIEKSCELGREEIRSNLCSTLGIRRR